MTVRVYRSTDASAPTLNGTSGSLINVLDGCLVNGYGIQTAAGWTKAFSGTNLAGYRQGTGSNQYYLKIRDDGVSNAVRVAGFEIMTTVTATDTAADGTNRFPLSGTNLFWQKSFTTDTIARPWIVLADARTFYIFMLTGDFAATYFWGGFGEFFSFKTSDPGRTFVFGRNGGEGTGAIAFEPDRIASIGNTIGSPAMMWVNRNYTGVAGSTTDFIMTGREISGGASSGTLIALVGNVIYSNQPDHKIYLAPLRVSNTLPVINFRGKMRGLWHYQHLLTTIADGETFTGSGNLAGKTFLAIKQTPNAGVWIVETSDTWDTN